MNKFFQTRKIIALSVLLVMLLGGCGNSERNESVKEFSERLAVSDDNQLIVYTSHKEEVYLPIIREFESRTGIWVDIHSGGTAEMMQAAKDASLEGTCDIMFGGGVESYEASKEFFLPYEPSELDSLNPYFIDADGYWTPFTELPIVFVYNKNLVSPSQAPTSWAELFNEKWKGQIAFANLEKSGTSYTIISTISQLTGEEPEDVLEAFIEQLDGKVLNSSGEIISEVSNGNCLIGITLEETALKAIDAGSNIVEVIPSEGTSAVPDGIAMMKNAPHSYNAGKFIDFVIGLDTQSYAMSKFYRRPVRVDVQPSKGLYDIELIDFDISKAANEEASVMKKWKSLMEDEDE